MTSNTLELKSSQEPNPSIEVTSYTSFYSGINKKKTSGRSIPKKIKDALNPNFIKIKTQDGKKETLRIESIAQMTELSKLRIVIKKITGSLSEVEIENILRIKQTLIKANQVRGSEAPILKRDLKKLIKIIHQVATDFPDTPATASFSIQDYTFTLISKKGQPLEIFYTDSILGVGAVGTVKEIKDIAGKQLGMAEKIANNRELSNDITLELHNLQMIHLEISDKYGKDDSRHQLIQQEPYCVFAIKNLHNLGDRSNFFDESQQIKGYMTAKFDMNLENHMFFQLSFEDRLKANLKLLEAVKLLHELNIVHEDLKPSNCAKTGDHFQICDFGGSRSINHSNFSNDSERQYLLKYSTFQSTISTLYTPPELFLDSKLMEKLQQEANTTSKEELFAILKAHDVYSMGLTLLSNLGDKCLEIDYQETYVDLDPMKWSLDYDEKKWMELLFDRAQRLRLKLFGDYENQDIADLIIEMLGKRKKRPNIEEVYQRYEQAIMQMLGGDHTQKEL